MSSIVTNIAITGTNSSSFVFSNSCGPTLAAGANCTIHGHFAPTTTGAKTAAITITDNATGSPQSVPMTGTGTTPAIKKSTVRITSTANPATTCNPITFTANVTSESGANPTGTIEFMDGVHMLGTAQIRSGEAAFSISPLSAKTMLLIASYPGDSTHEAAASPAFQQVVLASAKQGTSCGVRMN